jgi:haloalkane dehalogenase
MKKMAAKVKGLDMAYVEVGEGDPIVFLHGNPTSSYLWRNIIPYLADHYRCIAPDLIGMGESAKLPNSGSNSYRFVEHREYLDGLLDVLDLGDRVTFVIHDWGSALGFDWANRHRTRVVGIAYMEAIVQPASWSFWPDDAQSIFKAMRSPAGESIVLEKNVFVDRILPGAILRDLSDDEMAQYKRPYTEPGESRRPTLTWPREIPIDGQPSDVHKIVLDYSGWMAENEIPKLFVNAEPGSILRGEPRSFCRTWKNQIEVTVRGSHFVQEDSPVEIGTAIRDWRDGLG